MTTFFDLFAFLSVLLNGLDLIAQSSLVGTITFLLIVAVPLQRDTFDAVIQATLRILGRFAAFAIVTASAYAFIGALALRASLAIPWAHVLGADFVTAALLKSAAAAAVAAIAWRGHAHMSTHVKAMLIVAAVAILAGLVATSHAAARPGTRTILLAATAFHIAGAAVWLGGLPCLWTALGIEADPLRRARIGKRYSAVAIAGVLAIAAGAAAMVIDYIGSAQGLYGTAYGSMAIGKLCLLCMLLLLGLGNFLSVRKLGEDSDASTRIRRFVEAEMGIGAAAIMLAASITSVPPAVDTVERITLQELTEHSAPRWPRLDSPDHASLAIPALQARLDQEAAARQASNRLQAFVPGTGQTPPRNAEDIAWSEYNHHWAGLVVLIIGLAALAQRSGYVPIAKHWPLLFVLLAVFLFYRADPEVWPAGSIGFFDSLKDPEVVQHRLFVIVIVAFALFEWGIRTGRVTSQRLALVFPLLTALGGTLLLTHSHAIANPRDQLLIEYTHLPMGIFGLLAGWTRWIEIRGGPRERQWAGWVWPVCFLVIGLLLLDYRES